MFGPDGYLLVDTSSRYFLGADDPGGRCSMSGPLHADWLCGEKAIGFEGDRILRCKFTSAPELSTRPIIDDTYKRRPTLVAQKLRTPHIGTFGSCTRLLEANCVPEIPQRGDDIAFLVNREFRIRLSRKRTVTLKARDVDEAKGAFRMQSDSRIREYVQIPPVRGAFYRYRVNLSSGPQLKAPQRCPRTLGASTRIRTQSPGRYRESPQSDARRRRSYEEGKLRRRRHRPPPIGDSAER